MSEDKNCNLIPEGHSNIHCLWWNVKNITLKEVIRSAIRRISFDIPDFKPKWSDVPEEKIDEWYDYVFGYDVTQWKPSRTDIHDVNHTNFIIEYRLRDLRGIIIDFFMEKFNIEFEFEHQRYKWGNNVEPERKEINEQA